MDPKKITREEAEKMLKDKPKTSSKTRRGKRGGAKKKKVTKSKK